MHNVCRFAFLCASLLAMNGAFAQVVVLFSVDGWGKPGDMYQASSFNMGFVDNAVQVQAGGVTGSAASRTIAGNVVIRDSVLTMPMGNAAMLFSRAVMSRQMLPTVTVQFAQANAKNPPIFQARLSDVLVTAVTLAKGSNDGGPGVAEVTLRGSRIEIFNNTQNPTGAIQPGIKGGFDARANKAF